MLDDPTARTIYRVSGASPYPDPLDPNPPLPVDVYPRQVTLRDRVTVATIVPFTSLHLVPASLLAYLSDQLNKEIDMGDTYPMVDTLNPSRFAQYWFQNFAGVMILGNIEHASEVIEGRNWATECLGSFYIKPNYPGRSSHICNAGFLVTEAARNRGVGRLMGETYLEWAPRLGYTYSVFNLVYETNVASCRIWDALGFKRIGRVKGAGNLKSHPGQLVDAIIYGRDLEQGEGDELVSEERFDKIRFYLKTGKYPAGADRAEKSRLRSAATHYKLIDEGDKLMLRDKEVISDAGRQYEIARSVHAQSHGGINKTTATIAEKHHWVRIKETVSLVIRNCAECKELGKAPVVRAEAAGVPSAAILNSTLISSPSTRRPPSLSSTHSPEVNLNLSQIGSGAAGRILSLHQSIPASPHLHSHSDPDAQISRPLSPCNTTVNVDSYTDNQHHPHHHHSQTHGSTASVSPQVLNRTLPAHTRSAQGRHRVARQNQHSHAHVHSHQHTSAAQRRQNGAVAPMHVQTHDVYGAHNEGHGLGHGAQIDHAVGVHIGGNEAHIGDDDDYMPLDPQIMEDMQHVSGMSLASHVNAHHQVNQSTYSNQHPHQHQHHAGVHEHEHDHEHAYGSHPDEAFRLDMLDVDVEVGGVLHGVGSGVGDSGIHVDVGRVNTREVEGGHLGANADVDADADADADLDMLIDQPDDDDDDDDMHDGGGEGGGNANGTGNGDSKLAASAAEALGIRVGDEDGDGDVLRGSGEG